MHLDLPAEALVTSVGVALFSGLFRLRKKSVSLHFGGSVGLLVESESKMDVPNSIPFEAVILNEVKDGGLKVQVQQGRF
jgi:hypothetical protein